MNCSMDIELEVKAGENGLRLDRWLSQQLSDLSPCQEHASRTHLQKLIAQGLVKLNNQVCRSKKTPLKMGDRLQVTIPPTQPLNLQPEPIPLDILYEDDSLIIINKPSGLVVHPAPGHETGTLVNALLYHCRDLGGIGGVERPGIVHRLDKDTTGALVVAKTDFAHQHLQAQIKAKTARREYLAVVHGAPSTTEGTIDLPIGRHPVHRKKMAVVPLQKGGRNALTHWQVLERLGNYTLIQYQLSTGRTHQIRVHSANMGHPIVGDTLYSSGGSLRVNLSGQSLHARRLSLQHPLSGEPLEAIAPLPTDFTKLLTLLRQRVVGIAHLASP